MLEARSSDAGQHIPDRGPQVFAGTLVTLILATVFVTARIICRHFIVRNVSWDDRVIVLAWVFAFFLSFTIMFGANHGLGRFDVNIQADERGILRRCEYVFSILYVGYPSIPYEIDLWANTIYQYRIQPWPSSKRVC
jgi:hypothetical protein